MLNKPIFYNKISIVAFSTLLTGVVGAILFGYNLRAVGKNKVVIPLILTMLVLNALLRALTKNFLPGAIYELFIPNLVCGLILAFPVWDMYLSEFQEHTNKHIWWPLLVVLILYGGLIIGNWIISKDR